MIDILELNWYGLVLRRVIGVGSCCDRLAVRAVKHFAESVVPIVEAVADGAGMDAVAAGARVIALEAVIVVAGNFADEVDLDGKAVLDMIPDRQNQLDWEECSWADDARRLTVASQFRIHMSLPHFQWESLPDPAAEIATAAVPSAAAIVATV